MPRARPVESHVTSYQTTNQKTLDATGSPRGVSRYELPKRPTNENEMPRVPTGDLAQFYNLSKVCIVG